MSKEVHTSWKELLNFLSVRWTFRCNKDSAEDYATELRHRMGGNDISTGEKVALLRNTSCGCTNLRGNKDCPLSYRGLRKDRTE